MHSESSPVYPSRMKGCRSDTRLTFSRRCVASVALVTFTLGNVGWPLDFGKTAGGQGCCAATGRARCCCGLEKAKSRCGCFKSGSLKRPVLAKTGSCCEKKRAAAEKSSGPLLNCGCDESSFPGFIVSSQPKLTSASIEMPELVETFAVSLMAPRARPNGAFPPETPPPRPSLS